LKTATADLLPLWTPKDHLDHLTPQEWSVLEDLLLGEPLCDWLDEINSWNNHPSLRQLCAFGLAKYHDGYYINWGSLPQDVQDFLRALRFAAALKRH
jgi:hypothetical protein